MARWQPLKKDVLEALAAEITHNYAVGRVIVAIDGSATSGTAAFADDLATALGLTGRAVFRASISDFHRERSAQIDADTARGYYDSSFDYSLLRRILVDPFRESGSTGFVLSGFDSARNVQVPARWTSAGPDAILLIDGVFLQRPELAGLWNFVVWLDDPEADAVDEHADAEALYVREVAPRAKAGAIIDNRDPDAPRRRFADSC